MESEKWVKYVLRQCDIGHNYQGYDYVVDGVQLVLEDPSRLKLITKNLYMDIAKKHRTSWKCVERDIRTVVDALWKEEENELLVEIWGSENKKRPRNARFFELLCEYIRKLETSESAMTAEDGCFMENPGDCFCPENGKYCEHLAMLRKQIICLRKEKERDPLA